MKRMICVMTCLLTSWTASGQWKWDGEAGDSSWTSAANWYPDGVPTTGDDVLLDNSLLNRDYEVRLPAGTISITLDSLILRPGTGRSIRLVIPSTNKAAPALSITGPGESLRVEAGAVLINASGATSGEPLQPMGWMRISDGGRYIHATPRANARLIDRLSTTAGTSTGIFEFDVPGTSGYTVSLTGNTFGSLVFRSKAAGGLKSYSGSGSSDLYIRGDLIVDTGVGFTSTLTANIRLDGHLLVHGLMSMQPPTGGVVGRSLIMTSPQSAMFEGSNIQYQQHFREILIGSGHQTLLRSNLNLPYSGQKIRVLEKGTLSIGIFAVMGSGSLELNAGGIVRMGHPAGIRADGSDGNIRTISRQLHTGGYYVFDGIGDQQTGDGLPDTIAGLTIDKASGGLYLTKTTLVTSNLGLVRGRIITLDNNLLDFSGDTISHQANEFGMDSCGGPSSFIDGPFRRHINRIGNFGMPVGKDGIFRPLTLSRTGNGSMQCRVSYSNDLTPAANLKSDPNIYQVNGSGYWIIQMQNITGDSSLLPELSWRFSGDSLPRKRWLDSLRIVTINPGLSNGWKINDSQPTIRDHHEAGTLMSDQPISSSCLMTLGTTGAPAGLPITDIRLMVRKIGNRTKLEWETTGTSESAHFIVCRSDDRQRPDTVGTLAATHTRNKERFSLIDEHPPSGWNTYKVCVTEKDQEGSRCSGSVAVYHTSPSDLFLFPVPAIERLHWKLSGKSDPGWIIILNNEGIACWRSYSDRRLEDTVDVHDWPPGIYHLIIPFDGTFIRRSFLKGNE